jgi:hypothetical protein
MSPEECMLYHLNFLSGTNTITFLRDHVNPYMDFIGKLHYAQIFASFVAPDRWNPHPLGTPGDIKAHYESAYTVGDPEHKRCMSLFGEDYGHDFVGNVVFGYIGRVAGFDEEFLLWGAGLAQELDTKTGGGGFIGESGGDAPEDIVATRVGLELYQKCGTDCTMADIEEVLRDFRAQYEASTSAESLCIP